jgi:multidrug efflux pump subunit AcrA (membrane-fusion protein)
MRFKDPRLPAVLATASLTIVVGGLVVQHLRHGWPFSLHHGLGAVASGPAAATGARRAAPTHPRAGIEIDPARMDTIGVKLETVAETTLSEPLRAVATIVPDEARVSHVHTRVSGWIEKLNVKTTGQRVRAGQPLASIFSQELLASQTEYLAARHAAHEGPASAVLEGARSRLTVLGMTDAEIQAIERAGEPRRLVTVTAPRSGVILHRGIAVGTAVDPSTELVTIADLSRVWALVDLAEADIPSVRVGTPASLEFPASGRPPLEATVAFVYPTLSERTRTLRVRFELPNPDGTLRPGLYGNATFRVAPRVALTVPRDAIVDTGETQHVFVAAGAKGRFEPRPVKLGARFGERIEVTQGLAAGETIVSSGVFLIDSESRLRASGGGAGHAHGGGGGKAVTEGEPAPGDHEGHLALRGPAEPASPGQDEHPKPTATPDGASAPPAAPAHGEHQGH